MEVKQHIHENSLPPMKHRKVLTDNNKNYDISTSLFHEEITKAVKITTISCKTVGKWSCEETIWSAWYNV